MSADVCRNCGCWNETREWQGKRIGDCRDTGPVFCFEAEQSSMGYWPETREDDWCGDHTALRHAELPGPNRGDA